MNRCLRMNLLPLVLHFSLDLFEAAHYLVKTLVHDGDRLAVPITLGDSQIELLLHEIPILSGEVGKQTEPHDAHSADDPSGMTVEDSNSISTIPAVIVIVPVR